MRRTFYYITMKNISPVHIGTGDGEYTDMDVLKDGNGDVFIPGTGLAGSIIHYLKPEDQEVVLPKEKDMTKQSPVYFSDAELVHPGKCKVESRDGIKLKSEGRNGVSLQEDKTVEEYGKYDYEIIPEGYSFKWRIEICDRKFYHEIPEDTMLEEIVESALVALHTHHIRVGFKTTRGLGKFELLEVRKKVFDGSNFHEYLKFDPYNPYDYKVLEVGLLKNKYDNKNTTVRMYLKQNGGISIRTYNTKKGDADFQHIHSAGKPVIPGTSWNGLIRKSLESIAKELGDDDAAATIDKIFGYVEGDQKKKSLVYIGESILAEGENITLTRNRINPFTGSTVTGALFKETSYYNGITALDIVLSEKIVMDKTLKNKIINMLRIFANDLNNGFIALGGQTSVGRGLFKVIKVEIDDVEDETFISDKFDIDGGEM